VEVLALFDELNAAGRTLVVITHEDEVAVHAKRVVRMRDGVVVEDLRRVPADAPPPWTAEAAGRVGTAGPPRGAGRTSAGRVDGRPVPDLPHRGRGGAS
jgi:putative ABC transport system ATP-binding protein